MEIFISAVVTLSCVLLTCVCAVYTGRLINKRGVIGITLGFLSLCGGANMGLWLVRSFRFSAPMIVPFSILFIIILALMIRLIFSQKDTLSKMEISWDRYHIMAMSLPVLIILLPIITPAYPLASANFFDAWTPLWISDSLEAGRFLIPAETALGRGFLTSADDYEWNVLGFVALLCTVSSVKPIIVSIAVQYAAKIFSIILIYAAISPCSRMALPVGIGFAMTFFTNRGTGLMITGRSWDDVFLLASAGIFFAAAIPGEHKERLKLIIIFSMFLGWGRKYAFFYGVVFSLCALTLLFIKSYGLKNAIKLLLPAGVIGILSILRPLQLMAQHKSFTYPRTNILDLYPRDLVKSVLGVLSDIGLLQQLDKSEIFIPSSAGLWLFLLVFFIVKRTSKNNCNIDMMAIYFPLLLPAAAIALEILTGYRKSTDFSKLFVSSVPFVVGYVWVLYRELSNFKFLALSAIYRKQFIIAILCCFAIDTGVHIRRVGVCFASNLGFLDIRPSELKMVDTLKKKLKPAEYQKIIDRPTMYLHYEPGIGYRYFAGGKISNDLDFWSDDVQKLISNSGSINQYMSQLGNPNVYVSYEPFYHKYTGYSSADRFLLKLGQLDRVKLIVADDGGKFFYYSNN